MPGVVGMGVLGVLYGLDGILSLSSAPWEPREEDVPPGNNMLDMLDTPLLASELRSLSRVSHLFPPARSLLRD